MNSNLKLLFTMALRQVRQKRGSTEARRVAQKPRAKKTTGFDGSSRPFCAAYNTHTQARTRTHTLNLMNLMTKIIFYVSLMGIHQHAQALLLKLCS